MDLACVVCLAGFLFCLFWLVKWQTARCSWHSYEQRVVENSLSAKCFWVKHVDGFPAISHKVQYWHIEDEGYGKGRCYIQTFFTSRVFLHEERVYMHKLFMWSVCLHAKLIYTDSLFRCFFLLWDFLYMARLFYAARTWYSKVCGEYLLIS